MLTPDDIRNITFTKTMGGYKTVEVDTFIDQCADTVAALENEKAELSKKLEVLADKLVEYRNEEDSIRTALLSAQRLGDTVVREANHKAGLILDDANIKAEKIVETARKNITDEEAELLRIRKEVSNFKSRMLSIYREHLALIDVLPDLREEQEEKAEPEQPADEEGPAAEEAGVPAPSAPETETPPTQPVPVAAEPAPVFEPVVEAPVTVVAQERTFALNIPEIEDEEPVPMAVGAAAAEPEETAGNPRFANLKFGDEYDISKDDNEPKGFFRRRK